MACFKNMKGWGETEIRSFWKQCEADVSIKRNFNGRLKGEELQMWIPVCRQGITDKTSFHEKKVDQSTKAMQGVKEADAEAMRKDTQFGHRAALSDSHFLGQAGVSATALSHGPAKLTESLPDFLQVPLWTHMASPAQTGASATCPASASPVTVGCQAAAVAAPTEIADVNFMRNKAFLDQRQQLAKVVPGLCDVFGGASLHLLRKDLPEDLDELLKSTPQERVGILGAIINKGVPFSDGFDAEAPAFAELGGEDEGEEPANVTPAMLTKAESKWLEKKKVSKGGAWALKELTRDNAAVVSALKSAIEPVTLLPVKNPEVLQPVCIIEEKVASIKSMESEKDILRVVEELESASGTA